MVELKNVFRRVVPVFSGKQLQAYKDVGLLVVGIDALQSASIILFCMSVEGIRQNRVRWIDVETGIVPRGIDFEASVFFLE